MENATKTVLTVVNFDQECAKSSWTQQIAQNTTENCTAKTAMGASSAPRDTVSAVERAHWAWTRVNSSREGEYLLQSVVTSVCMCVCVYFLDYISH